LLAYRSHEPWNITQWTTAKSKGFNRTLGNMIKPLPLRAKQDWLQMLQTLTFAYNCTFHESTVFALFLVGFPDGL